MISAFVDTNILIDLIADRPPFSKFAIKLFGFAEKRKVKLYISSHSLATAHYVLKKHFEESDLREILFDLLDLVEIVPIDLATIKKSLLSKHKDFEDAIQIFAANSIKEISYIVTRNVRDFKDAGMIVCPPDEIFNYI